MYKHTPQSSGAIGPSRDSERAAIHAWNKATEGTKYDDIETDNDDEVAETEGEPKTEPAEVGAP